MISRRQALMGIGAVLGASITEVTLAKAWVAISKADPKTSLTAVQMKTLEIVSDQIIPRTETPGALDVKVPAFIDHLLTHWASPVRKNDLLSAVDMLVKNNLSATDSATLRKVDAAAYGEGGPLSQTEKQQYIALKSLILSSYYSSEVGASEELGYELVPGPFEGDIDYASIGKAWY